MNAVRLRSIDVQRDLDVLVLHSHLLDRIDGSDVSNIGVDKCIYAQCEFNELSPQRGAEAKSLNLCKKEIDIFLTAKDHRTENSFFNST